MKKILMALISVLLFTGTSYALTVASSNTATDYTDTIMGSGVTLVGAPNLTSVTNQSAATFTGGIASGVGFESGILLTTGNVNDVAGPNNNGTETVGVGNTFDDDVSTNLGTAGDADLTALAGFNTFDAAKLEFDFQFGDGSIGGDLYFNFVFASEEYLDYVGSSFNDVFGFFVDGVNIGLVPGTSDPITINTVNNSTNSAYYKNNVDNTNGIANLGLDISFDGLTTVIGAELTGLAAGTHSMKFAVADGSDGILDAGVFIQAGTFSSEATPTEPVPEPSTMLLLGAGLMGLLGFRKKFTK